MKTELPPLREDHHGVIPYAGTLYDIETMLIALTEIDPADLTPELRAEYERDLQEAIRKAPEKRERVAIKLFDLGQRSAVKRAAAQAHLDRARELQASADRYERDADRLKEYVLTVMRELPKPKRGCRTLEGLSATFKAKGVADSVEITDETALPAKFKIAIVTFPLLMWRGFLETISADEEVAAAFSGLPIKWGRVPSADIKVALQQTVKCAVCAGTQCPAGPSDAPLDPCKICQGTGQVPVTIPGAHLVTDKLRLEVS